MESPSLLGRGERQHRQPVVSRLISRYDLTINIVAALLQADTRDDGWFNLEIQGSSQQVEAAVAYLEQLQVEIVQLNFQTLTPKSIEKHLLCASILSTFELKDDELDLTLVQGQTTRAKFQVYIGQNYNSSPIISGLVSCFGLTVNIAGANLDAKTKDDGWFDARALG